LLYSQSYFVGVRKLWTPTHKFSDWKQVIFRCGKKIKGLYGGVVLYAAQISPQINTATAEKGRFRMKTISLFPTSRREQFLWRAANNLQLLLQMQETLQNR